MVERYGYRRSGIDGSLVHVRRTMDAGACRHVGELEPADLETTDFTPGTVLRAHETFRSER